MNSDGKIKACENKGGCSKKEKRGREMKTEGQWDGQNETTNGGKCWPILVRSKAGQ